MAPEGRAQAGDFSGGTVDFTCGPVSLQAFRSRFGPAGRCGGPGIAPGRLLELMAVDKKTEAGRLRFILLDRIGAASVRAEVPAGLLQQTLAAAG